MARGVSPKPGAWIARVGLVTLFWILLGLVSGAPLFFGRRGWWDPVVQPLVLVSHIYVSTLSVPFMVAKIWGTLGLLKGAPPQREAPLFDRGASIALIVSAIVLYGSGIALIWNTSLAGNAVLKDVHLYSTFAMLFPLTWHLIRRFTQSWRLVQSVPAVARPGGWVARLYTRRAVLALLVGILGSAALRLAMPARASEDPNDFPVTNFGHAAGSIDLNTWRLTVRGAVAKPVQLSYEELLKLPRERHRYSLDCVTGWSATREWEGIPIIHLLRVVEPLAPEPRLRFVSVTGYEAVMVPYRYTTPGSMLATHVSGVPFTPDHGFPIRLMVPGVIGEENVKWLAEIEVIGG